MSRILNHIVADEKGVLTFEWILLLAVLVVGIVGGLSAVRDSLIVELSDVSAGILSLSQSYLIKTPVLITQEQTLAMPIGPFSSGIADGSVYEDLTGEIELVRMNQNLYDGMNTP